MIKHSSDIYTIPDFLSDKECDELIKFSETRGYEKAKVNISGKQLLNTMVRNNERVLFKSDEHAEDYWNRLSKWVVGPIGNSTPIGLNELFRFYKYSINERFLKHRDGSYERNELEYSLLTFMVYLNDNFTGGETTFGDIKIEPKKGTALIFRHELKHAGVKVIDGVKYVLRSDVMYRLKRNDS